MKQLNILEKKILIIGFLIFWFVFSGCDSEDVPECLQAPGRILRQEVLLESFDKIVVYGKIKVFIEQGMEQKLIFEAGENLVGNISAEVKDGQLSLRDKNTCDFFRTTYVPVVYVTVPNLTYMRNAGNQSIEGVGELYFRQVTLRSLNQEKNPEIYTNGNFKLNLISDVIDVGGDDFSNFYLKGRTKYLFAALVAGNGRLEAGELIADSIRIFHRGTNKMILNPQQSLKGEIRSTGDVISVNRPPMVEVQSFYSGKLYFIEQY
ncbi:head GIN domain-containing protein [Salinimicrobium catena]|uniref:head GIN domain-containing protein n=1 Tax=Salinimicrobium catena TaxID=390640 RepID=UPI002FE4BED8